MTAPSLVERLRAYPANEHTWPVLSALLLESATALESARAAIERKDKALRRFVEVEGEPREFKSKRNRLGTRTMTVCPYCELVMNMDFHETSCPLGLARAALEIK